MLDSDWVELVQTTASPLVSQSSWWGLAAGRLGWSAEWSHHHEMTCQVTHSPCWLTISALGSMRSNAKRFKIIKPNWQGAIPLCLEGG